MCPIWTNRLCVPYGLTGNYKFFLILELSLNESQGFVQGRAHHTRLAIVATYVQAVFVTLECAQKQLSQGHCTETLRRLVSSKRAFDVVAPKAWNRLPVNIKSTRDTGLLEKELKFLFIPCGKARLPCILLASRLLYCIFRPANIVKWKIGRKFCYPDKKS